MCLLFVLSNSSDGLVKQKKGESRVVSCSDMDYGLCYLEKICIFAGCVIIVAYSYRFTLLIVIIVGCFFCCYLMIFIDCWIR